MMPLNGLADAERAASADRSVESDEDANSGASSSAGTGAYAGGGGGGGGGGDRGGVGSKEGEFEVTDVGAGLGYIDLTTDACTLEDAVVAIDQVLYRTLAYVNRGQCCSRGSDVTTPAAPPQLHRSNRTSPFMHRTA